MDKYVESFIAKSKTAIYRNGNVVMLQVSPLPVLGK